MTPLQISALMGQWFGAAICLGAIIVCAVGINIEQKWCRQLMAVGINIELKFKAPRGFLWITVGSFLGLVGGTIFALATKMLGF